MRTISIIAPMYNEEALVFEYTKITLLAMEQLKNDYKLEIVLVNDGSKDSTYEKMQELYARYPDQITLINLSRNFGLEGAVRAGLSRAIGDAVVVMDADLQDPPRLIIDMVRAWEQGADVVVGSRIKRSHDGFFKRMSAGLYYRVLNSLSGKLKLEQSAANFRLLSRKAVDQVLALPEVNPVFRVVVPFVGMKTAVVEYDRDERYAGSTKYKLSTMIRYALDSLTGISIEPLRKLILAIPLSLLILMVGLSCCWIIEGTFSVALIIILCLGLWFILLFVSVAIIGEYIGQILTEAKGRPTSIIYDYLPAKAAQRRKNNEIC